MWKHAACVNGTFVGILLDTLIEASRKHAGGIIPNESSIYAIKLIYLCKCWKCSQWKRSFESLRHQFIEVTQSNACFFDPNVILPAPPHLPSKHQGNMWLADVSKNTNIPIVSTKEDNLRASGFTGWWKMKVFYFNIYENEKCVPTPSWPLDPLKHLRIPHLEKSPECELHMNAQFPDLILWTTRVRALTATVAKGQFRFF